jgi:hypothetical protein
MKVMCTTHRAFVPFNNLRYNFGFPCGLVGCPQGLGSMYLPQRLPETPGNADFFSPMQQEVRFAFTLHCVRAERAARASNKTNPECMAPAGGRVCNLCVLNAAPVAQLNPAYSNNKFRLFLAGRLFSVSAR